MIAIGSDHGGYNLKAEIIKHLEKNGYEVKDFGTYKADESVDYPDYALEVANAIIAGEAEKGILICGTGIGISISANKVPGIRCAVCTNSFMAKMAREHNNAQILAMGERVIGLDLALDIVDTFIKSNFTEGRHARRVAKIHDIEKKTIK